MKTKQETLIDIAIVRGHDYASSKTYSYPIAVQRESYADAKNSYVDGFLAGVAFRMSGGQDEET